MKEIIKRIAVVTAIMFIALGGCISYASDKDWWICLIPSVIGLLILLGIYTAQKIETNKKRKFQHSKIDFNERFITISINGNEYRIPKEKSQFKAVLESREKKYD